MSFDLEVCRERRARLIARVGEGVVILNSAPELTSGGDTEIPYRQDADLYYLTGFQEPGTVAVLSNDEDGPGFTLFVRPRDPAREAWSGPRAGVDGAVDEFGADAAFPIDELDQHLPDLVRPADKIFYSLGLDAAMDDRVTGLIAAARAARPRTGQGPSGIEDLDPILSAMRRTKDAVELTSMRRSAEVAVAAHRATMAAARPGMGEWELEAVLEYNFRAMGATGPAFPSIVGAGENATVLHYTANNRRINDGDLVLVDAGADLGMYCSDLTRTFPISGRFSSAQRELYAIVLAAEEAAIGVVQPGAAFAGIHQAAVRVLVEGLLTLGILEGSLDELIESGDYRRYYPHRTSHWLGLNVHDVGMYREGGESVLLEPGMVLTVEPGLYIPADAEDIDKEYLGIGIRIEDDVVVTADGHEILTRGVPVAVDEIEALVGSVLR
ncbi:MAG TPA: aminopeptidase P N-terminal domain-containing protein [Longimicrobiaceae bacterium]|nr:aminopeptidase P N-terminal domain-containing protein [Longimicrobiaceae bacterium]